MTQMQQDSVTTKASIKNLETQMAQLASQVGKMDTTQGRLPAQAQVNPRENANAITLRSGKEL